MFSDEEISDNFDLSTSKMRTAQRYGLVRSKQQNFNSRIQRAWTNEDVLSVKAADVLAGLLDIPFDASIQIVHAMGAEALNAVRGPETEAGALRRYIPLVCLYDRHLVALTLASNIVEVGLLGRADKGKNVFSPLPPSRIEEPECDGYAEACIAGRLSEFKTRNLKKLFAGGA